MLEVKTNALTEKGVMRPAVRTAVRTNITDIVLKLANDTEVVLENKGNGNYFATVAQDADGVAINAKVELTITTNEYKAPVKKVAPAKEPEVIEVL